MSSCRIYGSVDAFTCVVARIEIRNLMQLEEYGNLLTYCSSGTLSNAKDAFKKKAKTFFLKEGSLLFFKGDLASI